MKQLMLDAISTKLEHYMDLLGKRQQLVGQRRRSLASVIGLLEDWLRGIACGEKNFREGDIALYDRQKIVEVVGNPAGQLAKRFELARAPQFIFHLPAMIDLGA